MGRSLLVVYSALVVQEYGCWSLQSTEVLAVSSRLLTSFGIGIYVNGVTGDGLFEDLYESRVNLGVRCRHLLQSIVVAVLFVRIFHELGENVVGLPLVIAELLFPELEDRSWKIS